MATNKAAAKHADKPADDAARNANSEPTPNAPAKKGVSLEERVLRLEKLLADHGIVHRERK